MRISRFLGLLLGAVSLTAAAACSSDDSGSGGSTYDVKAGDTTCDVESTEFPAGDVTLDVENTGSDVTEVYVYGLEGDEFSKIMGEIENVGPGTSQDFTVSLTPGDYQVACKPGMQGDGIRTDITVTGDDSGAAEGSEGLYDRELEFAVGESGNVTLPEGGLTAVTGEKIEFKMQNDSPEEYYIKLLDPEGTELGEAEAAAGSEAEFIAEMTAAGDYTLQFYADGAEADATTYELTVTDTG
jgi:iron uptake system component EfeO